MMGHVLEHEVIGGLQGVSEDETALEGGIKAAMIVMREEDEVLCTVVGWVTIKVMALKDASVLVDGSWTMEGGAHKDVTQLVSVASHEFVPCPSARLTGRSIRTIAWFEFFTFFVEESSIGTAEEDLASCQFDRTLFCAWIKTRVTRSTAAQ